MFKRLNLKIKVISLLLSSLLLAVPSYAQTINHNISSNIYFSEWSRLRHLASLGEPAALFQLGNLYYQSPPHSGIPQSSKKAFQLFMRAAHKGHVASQHNVGVLYLKGQGVSQNLDKALAWFMIAAENGNKSAKRAVARLSTSTINMANVNKLKTNYLHQIATKQLAK